MRLIPRLALWFGLPALALLSAPLAAQQQEYTIHGTDIRVRLHVQQTAGELFDQCNFDFNAPPNEAFICVGYLAGAEDGMGMVWAANGLNMAYCKPENIERRVLLTRFLDYMRAHPDKRELPAALVVLQAYREAFPCPARTSQ